MNYQEQTNVYGGGHLNHKYRKDILENNYNFYLSDDELGELLSLRPPMKPNVTFKQYITYHNTDFLRNMDIYLKKANSLSDNNVWVKLWSNHKRINNYLLGIENERNEGLYQNRNFEIYRPEGPEEVKEILNSEFFLLDTETTGFSKLSQIIEFGGVLYNRKALKSRIAEIRKHGLSHKNSVLYLFNYVKDQTIDETTIFQDIKSISLSNQSIEEKREAIFKLITTAQPDCLLDQKVMEQITDFAFKYNRFVHFYIKPYKDVSNDQALQIHHISTEKTVTEGKDAEIIVGGLHKFLKDKVIIAHNVKFDMEKIAELFNDFDMILPPMKKIIDSIQMFQELIKGIGIASKTTFQSLDYMVKLFLGVDMKALGSAEASKDRHTAIYDVKLTHRTLRKALEFYEEKRHSELEVQRLLCNINKQDKQKLKALEAKQAREEQLEQIKQSQEGQIHLL